MAGMFFVLVAIAQLSLFFSRHSVALRNLVSTVKFGDGPVAVDLIETASCFSHSWCCGGPNEEKLVLPSLFRFHVVIAISQ